MKNTTLVQRLNPSTGYVNPFSFGGGSSGMSKEGEEFTKDLFSFEYMGNAYFEHGIINDTLKNLFESDLTTSIFEVEALNDKIVYVICPKNLKGEVIPRIIEIYHFEETEHGQHLKEKTFFKESIDKPIEYMVRGWLELDNGFFWFTDRTMFEKVKEKFNVE